MSDELKPQEVVENTPQVETKSVEYNWKELRERTEKEAARAAEAEKKIEEYERYIEELEAKKAAPVSVDNDDSMADDSLVEARHYKQLKKEQQELKALIQEQNRARQVDSAALRLKSQYSDIEKVVNDETLSKLKLLKPALFQSMVSNPDPYERGAAAYDMIKAFNLDQDFSEDKKRIEKNMSKPQAANSVDGKQPESSLARVGDYDRRVLSEERKDQLRRQVEEAKRNRV